MQKRSKRLTRENNINDMDFLMSLDPDLREYFDDIGTNKSNNSKLKRKKKANFSIGDEVEISDGFGTIILGPYTSDKGSNTYEIECENGDFVTVEDDGEAIKIYVAPIEENDDDGSL